MKTEALIMKIKYLNYKQQKIKQDNIVFFERYQKIEITAYLITLLSKKNLYLTKHQFITLKQAHYLKYFDLNWCIRTKILKK